ncbi:hypothetical protein KOW79_013927 [Hemibagrus wyckioides]|uniref:G-protein coupled receptors family 1 profile domain-containing protein n=1 Tax=Hemibagrus wyckioides TaxID=337641 RepID=A0A9D3SFN2_9TELE|nr:hypothetical protein KOW79_013927 [Hemibagrus wyckioides]
MGGGTVALPTIFMISDLLPDINMTNNTNLTEEILFSPYFQHSLGMAAVFVLAYLFIFLLCMIALMLTAQQERSHFMVQDDNYNLTYPLYSCYETWPEPEMRKVYTTVLFAHIYLIPLILIVIMYGRIGAKLYSTTFLVKVNQPDVTPQRKSPISHRKIKVIKMLIVVALLFMLSWLPLWTLMLLTDYARPEGDQLDLLTGYIFPFSHWLAFSNSSVNPIIYGYYNKNFRRGFQAAWMQRPSCCLDRPSQIHLRRVKRGNKTCSHLDKALNTNLGIKNKIYTDNDLTGCVRLEMEHRKVSKEMRSSGAEGGNRGTAIKRELLEDIERISPTGPTVYQAWEL